MPLNYSYTVNDKKFINFFQASEYAHEHNGFVDFKVDPTDVADFCSVDVARLEQMDIRDLYKKKIAFLRENFGKLRLLYSGGTDSHTILDLAKEIGIEFDEVLTELVSIKGNTKLDIEYLPAIEYVKHNGIKNHHCIRPELQHYEIYKDPTWVKDVCGSQWFSFRGAKFDLTLRDREPMTLVTGHDKTYMYVSAEGKYYWIIRDVPFSEEMRYDQVAFYLDSIMPEVAVKQAYMRKRYLQKYRPMVRGLVDGQSRAQPGHPTSRDVSLSEQEIYYEYLGRSSPLSELTKDPVIMGKGYPTWNSPKHFLAMEELKEMGRGDLVEAFFNSMEKVKEAYKNHKHCLSLTGKGYPIGSGYYPMGMVRWGAVLELGDDFITPVDDSVIDLSLRS
jgi:hypothetical protein